MLKNIQLSWYGHIPRTGSERLAMTIVKTQKRKIYRDADRGREMRGNKN